MTKSVRLIPEGYHSVTPYLIVGDAAGAIAFYKEAFGATERMRMPSPGGKVGHAEIEIGGSVHHAGGRAPGGHRAARPSRRSAARR